MVRRRGFSIVELVVVIGIASLLIVAATVLIGRFFTVSRSQFEQTRTTEDARIQLERLTDIVRNARSLDCDGSGTPEQAQEWWLQTAESARAVFYSNVDIDAAPERVAYQHAGTDLVRTVDQDTASPCSFTPGSPQVVAHSVYNTALQPLFEYIASDGSTLSGSFTPQQVARVRVQLIIDANGQTAGNEASLITEITPRLGQAVAVAAPDFTPSPTPTSAPNTLTLHVLADFVKAAPEQSPLGPVWIDFDEQYSVALMYGDEMVDPSDPDLSFVSNNPAVVTVTSQTPAGSGRLRGIRVGSAKVTATYKGATLPFDVLVRAGCWGNTSGGWLQLSASPQSFLGPGPQSTMAGLCQQSGYSGPPSCGRVCSDVPQPGIHNHLRTSDHNLQARPCGFPTTGVVLYEALYCTNP
jgi:prepilin-type N-terminal cleavage/methylation domain-containing protein